MEKLLILGIDPGTTLGYALLDSDGKLVKKVSSKGFTQGKLISEIIKHGKILVVGCDKKRVPSYVNDVTIKLGARMVKPKENLGIRQKRILTREYKTKDSHELDALASAIYAYKEIMPLLRKIRSYVKKNKKTAYENELREIVVIKGMSVNAAMELIEKLPKKIIVEKVVERRVTSKEVERLVRKIKRFKKENKLIKTQNEKLKSQIKADKERYKYLKRKIDQLIPDEKAEELLGFREERIISLQRDINLKIEEITELQEKINNLILFISNMDGKVIVKKLKNLGWIEVQNKVNLLNIKKGDILIIDDISSYSQKSIDYLKYNIGIIISDKTNKTLEKDFLIIKKKELKINEIDHFALVDEKELDELRKKRNILEKVIRDYQKERVIF